MKRDGEPMPPLASARAASLLGYLLLHRHGPLPRERIAFTLWPDSTEPQARTNLRHLVHELRRSLPELDHLLDIRPRTLEWRPDARIHLDVAAFEESLALAEAAADAVACEAFTRSIDLYGGDLLEGCYDDWILAERERLRRRYGEALERLIALFTTRGSYADAIHHAEQLLQQDPLREHTYRTLMQLHDARGDRARALRVYHNCSETLERELGVEPSESTRRAYESLLVPAPPLAGGQTAHVVGGLPLVGRAREWTRLTDAWLASEDGCAQLVLVTGEAGIGKTRLVEDLRTWCVHRGASVADARAYAAEGVLPYAPVVTWLRSEAFRSRLARVDRNRLRELGRLLPEIDTTSPAIQEPIEEAELRQRLFDAIARTILAPGTPVLLVADDLQWFDRETLQCMHYLLRVDPQAHLLIAATVRSGEVDASHPVNELIAGLRALNRCVDIEVERLTREDTATLAERFGASLEAPAAAHLYRETEGNPLFVIEALRAGWRGGSRAERWTTEKVQSVIESRLVQLSEPARDLLAIAATIGREFTSDVLARVSQLGDDALVGALDELWRRRLVRERGADAYDFSHDKIREVVSLTASPARRRRDHLRVASVLERMPGQDLDAVAGIIAVHYDRAGAVAQAIEWYERSAAGAQRLHANVEALHALDRALEMLRACPQSAERDSRELTILATQTTLLGTVEGFASSVLAEIHRRARDIAAARRIELLPPLLRSIALASLSRGDFEGARPAGVSMRARAERDGDEMLRVEAEYVLGIAAFWQGALASARDHFQEAITHYRPEHRLTHIFRYGQDSKVVCLSRLGNTLWFLGESDQAFDASDRALVLADEIGHPNSRGLALVFASMLSVDAHHETRLRSHAAALTASAASDHASIQVRVTADAVGGYIDVLDGRAEFGIGRVRRALDDLRGVEHAPGMQAFIVRLLLEGCVAGNRARTGLEVADRALESSGAVRLWEAEVRRLRATFLAVLGAVPGDVKREFARVHAVAREQGARALELRICATNLRYCQDRGDRLAARSARSLLSGVIDTYPSGAASFELRDATALLSA